MFFVACSLHGFCAFTRAEEFKFVPCVERGTIRSLLTTRLYSGKCSLSIKWFKCAFNESYQTRLTKCRNQHRVYTILVPCKCYLVDLFGNIYLWGELEMMWNVMEMLDQLSHFRMSNACFYLQVIVHAGQASNN